MGLRQARLWVRWTIVLGAPAARLEATTVHIPWRETLLEYTLLPALHAAWSFFFLISKSDRIGCLMYNCTCKCVKCDVHTWAGDIVRMCLATCFLPSCTLQLCLANWAALQIYRLIFNNVQCAMCNVQHATCNVQCAMGSVQCAMCSPWGTKCKKNLATATSLPLPSCTLKLRFTQLCANLQICCLMCLSMSCVMYMQRKVPSYPHAPFSVLMQIIFANSSTFLDVSVAGHSLEGTTVILCTSIPALPHNLWLCLANLQVLGSICLSTSWQELLLQCTFLPE